MEKIFSNDIGTQFHEKSLHVCMILGQKNCPNRESKSVLITGLIRVCKNRVKNNRYSA